MIKDNQTFFNRMHVVIDGFVIAFTYVAAWFIQFRFFAPDVAGKLPLKTYMSALVILVPGLLLLYYAFNLYTSKRVQGRRLELSNIIKANTIALLMFFTIAYMQHEINFSRKMLCIFYVLNIVTETVVRNIIRILLMNIRRRDMNLKHIILVGYSLDEIVITLGLNEYDKLERIVALCEKSGVHTKFVPDYNNIIPTRPYTEDLLGLPVINIRHVPLTNTFNSFVKRVMDFFGALVAIVIFSPIMLVFAILVKLTSKGPLIFKQERVGLHNRPFYMYKFRSMEVQKETDEKSAWTTKNDPRVTGVGKFMRKTSIDELPQLFNVLKGDMSLVGPRPERPQFVEKFREEIPRYMVKHQVRPGMTGWAQINGYRGDTSIKRRIEYDLYYIENWTVGLDIKILILTFFKGFINKNAY